MQLREGDSVKLKAGVKPIEVLDFHYFKQYFDSADVGTVHTVRSARMRVKAGCGDYQTVVSFKKDGVDMTVRVETKDLVKL